LLQGSFRPSITKRVLPGQGPSKASESINNFCHRRANILCIIPSFWTNVIEKVNPPPATTARFLKDFTAYLNSLPEEAADRASGRLRSIDEHFELRRQTGGLQPSFVFNVMHLDFAEEVSEHPHIVRMKMATGDLVIIANVSSILTSVTVFCRRCFSSNPVICLLSGALG